MLVWRYYPRGLPGSTQRSYPNRLIKSGLQSLEMRRFHYDLVMTYKIQFGKVKVNMHDFFSYANYGSNTRGHCFIIFTQHCRVNTRNFLLAQRVVEHWNSMPAADQDFSRLRVFKTFLKTVDFNYFSNCSVN